MVQILPSYTFFLHLQNILHSLSPKISMDRRNRNKVGSEISYHEVNPLLWNAESIVAGVADFILFPVNDIL